MAMQLGRSHATDMIGPHGKEAVKQYVVFDVSFRMVATYVALTDAVHGAVCLKTEYAYDGNSSRIIKMKESLATWDSAWDI